MSLSRDVLKWLQSLDLTFPVKNAKRDFSNGYTIAEIFACYFPQDIQMHSYDNATSVAKKNDNWEQLERFFRKKNIMIDHDLIVDTIHCKGNAALALIEEIYTFLTNKKPIKRPVVAQEEPAQLPTFARPTASQLIKDNISTADMSSKDASRLVANKAQTILEKQKEVLKQERLQELARKKAEYGMGKTSIISPLAFDPLHPHVALSPRSALQLHPLPYTPISPLQNLSPQKDRAISPLRSSRSSTPIEKQKALKSAIARKGIAPVTNSPDLDIPEIEFKPVQVKTIPNDVAEKLRAKSATPSMSASARHSTPYLHQNGSKTPDQDGKFHPMLPIVSEVVENKLANSDLLYSFDPKAELGLSFFESLSRLPADVISEVFVDLGVQTTKFCRSFFDNPKEMLYFFTLVAPIFTFTNNRRCIDAILHTLRAIGDKMTSYDASTTWLLFERNVFPFLVNFVSQNPHRHHDLASVVFSFCPDSLESHTTVISKLRELAESTSTFTFCLLKLLQSENSETIVSLYQEEALKALRNQDASQVVHAVAVAILAEIIPFDYQAIIPGIDFVAEIGETSIWWEVKAQAIYLFCELLKYANITDDEVHSHLCEVIGKVIASSGNVVLRILGSMALAPYLHTHQVLYPLYIELLLSFSPALLTSLLFDKDSLPTLITGYGDSVGNYKAQFIPPLLHASEFLSYLVQELKATGTNKLLEQHLLLIFAGTKLIPADIERAEPMELNTWTQVFAEMMEFICLAFCNDQTCEYAENVLKGFMVGLKQHSLQVFPILHSTIFIVFPNETTNFGTPNSVKCQQTMIRFLLDLHDESLRNHPYFVTALENLIRNFPEYLAVTKLDVVIDKVTNAAQQ